jgi:NADP-dependent 3-hydroxy acid dehydrogenase YdfG
MSSLSNKVALVTGASRGIGLAISNALRDSGAHVVRLARSLDPANKPGQTDIRCDLTVPNDVGVAVDRLLNDPGAPDVVVNNAGVFLMKPVADTSIEEFEQQLAVNLKGPFLLLRALLPHLIRKGGTHIVNIGSIADHVAYAGNAAYGASKFGLRGLHEVIRRELDNTDVRLTLVSPGPTNTELWDSLETADRNDVLDRSDMLNADDVAQAVLFAVMRPPGVNVDLIRIGPVH